jgi:paraquat-inducible protein B
MHSSIKLFIAIATLFTIACNNNPTDTPRTDGFSTKPQTKEDSLHHQVMEGHDVGMAKMGRLRKYLAQIQQQTDSLNKLPVKQQDKQYLQALAALQQDLKNAENRMNTWMEEYKDDSAKTNETLRIQYLEKEIEKVNQVKTQILQTLQRADSLLLKTR